MSAQAGALLRAWRVRRGLTQVGLGELVARRAQSISAYEAGDNAPEPDVIRALDAALDAGGELLEAYGLNPLPTAPQMWGAIQKLEQLVEKAVERIERQADQLERRIERLEHPPDR